jgi:23S rRNA pseudouridine1911/1915/1917 synthase
VKTGDVIQLEIPALEKIEAQAEAIAFPILHEDDDLLVIDKPAGMVVHPGRG